MTDPDFRLDQPVAWAFHRNTSRWPFNVLDPDEVDSTQLPAKEYPEATYLALPLPQVPDVSLADAIRARVSCRHFAEAPLTQVALGTLLHAAYGVHGRIELGSLEFLERPVPSGGALYPLEIYVAARAVEGIDPGIYHYAVLAHGLEEVRSVPLPEGFLGYLFMGQHYVGEASAVVVLTSVVYRSLRKYGDRGYRYVLFEAGHVAQNLNLMVAALRLGSLNLGGFFDQDVAALLDVSLEREIPLYAVAVGIPSIVDRAGTRAPLE
jgi:SagB-type dehydrogenase family enzyme